MSQAAPRMQALLRDWVSRLTLNLGRCKIAIAKPAYFECQPIDSYESTWHCRCGDRIM